jgi:hypothetical protein
LRVIANPTRRERVLDRVRRAVIGWLAPAAA